MADGSNFIPDRTINYNVTADDGNIFYGVATVDLPEIQKMTNTLSGSGIAGEVETPIPGHFQSMEATINWSSITKEAVSLLKDGMQSLTFRIAQNQVNASSAENAVKAVRIHIRGLTKTSALGSAEVNAKTEQTTVLEVSYLHLFIDDEDKLEIDKLNMVYTVNGEDQLGGVRKALGLG